MSEEKEARKVVRAGLYRGLTAVCAFTLSLSMGAGTLLEGYRSTIDSNLGTTSEKFVSTSTADEPLYENYKPSSDVLNADGTGNSRALIQKGIDLGRKQEAEGAVLLKNNTSDGRGLPLQSGENVSLFGIRSHTMLLGSGMGTKVMGPCISLEQALSQNKTDFKDTIARSVKMQMGKAGGDDRGISFTPPQSTMPGGWSGDEFDFEGAGLNINPTLVSAYTSLNETYNHAENEVATPDYDPKEPSRSEVEQAAGGDLASSCSQYGDAAIVTISRASAEANDFLPGSVADGIGASDPLELTDNEREAIKMAEECSKNVVVLVNTDTPVQIQELADDPNVSAILWVGHPGAYGTLGIADLLVGRANPSGSLSDTYAVNENSAPSAKNMGDFTYANKDVLTRSAGQFGDTSSKYVIEAEGIYTGYKYYETRYYDAALGQGNATSEAGATAGEGAWNYDDEVTYSFGYGLSYTTFKQELMGEPEFSVTKGKNGETEAYATFKVNVTNTGDVAGKSAVQVYGQAPYTAGGVEKPAVQLLGFGKTSELAPGASEEVDVKVDLQYIASYDSEHDNGDGTKGTYILDPGSYYFAIGNGAHDALNNMMAAQGVSTAKISGASDASKACKKDIDENFLAKTAFSVSKTGQKISNQLEYSDWNHFQDGEVTNLSRADWDATWPKTYSDMELKDDELISDLNAHYYDVKTGDDTSSITWGKDSGIKFWDLFDKKFDDEAWDKAMDELSLQEALNIATFGGPSIPGSKALGTYEDYMTENNGIGISLALNASKDKNAPWAIADDDANAGWIGAVLGSAPVVAASFDPDLMGEVGDYVGDEALFLGIPILWGPGLNTHRSAYNGRNGEYYSEDAILTGNAAMEFAIAAEKKGLIASPKHFAFNDQETNRYGIAPYMTEQKAREGDLRAFQIAFEATKYDTDDVDEGMKGVMTSFSKVGPVECTSSYGLITGILKNEWGFHGYCVTDIYDDTDLYGSVLNSGVTCWDTRGISGFDGGTTIESTSIFAKQNDGLTPGIETVKGDAHLQQNVKDAAHNVLFALSKSNLTNRYNSTAHVEQQPTWWRIAYIAAIAVSAVLTVVFAVLSARTGKKNSKKEA